MPRAPAGPLRPVPKQADDGLIGRLTIPRLRLTTIVREGDDDTTLRRAAGHVPGSAIPGQFGNIAIAAHRDSFFRDLREIEKDDEIRIATRYGDFVYRVESVNIVKPDNIESLQPTRNPVLTLITCYPFNYVGHAPKRYIVRAREIEAIAADGAAVAPVPKALLPLLQAKATRAD